MDKPIGNYKHMPIKMYCNRIEFEISKWKKCYRCTQRMNENARRKKSQQYAIMAFIRIYERNSPKLVILVQVYFYKALILYKYMCYIFNLLMYGYIWECVLSRISFSNTKIYKIWIFVFELKKSWVVYQCCSRFSQSHGFYRC